jgi:hypothetical protein
MEAIRWCHAEVVAVLIAAGANLHVKNQVSVLWRS